MANYTINSQKGITQANSMKAGDTFKATDGSTWKKNSNNTITVTTKSGNTLNGVVGSSGSSSSSSSNTSNKNTSSSNKTSSSSSNKTSSTISGGSSSNNSSSSSSSSSSNKNTSGSYTINSQKGITQANSMKAGDTFVATDGSTWKKNADNSITVTTRNGSTLKGVVGSSGSSSSSSSSGSSNTGSVATSTQTPSGTVSSNMSSGTYVKVGADGKAPSGLKAGTYVVTNGGTYQITGVNADGSYKQVVADANMRLNNIDQNALYSGVYNIGTPAGASQYLTMKAGDTFKATDGSTWTKNVDGTISVVTANGNKYLGNVDMSQLSTAKTGSGKVVYYGTGSDGNMSAIYEDGTSITAGERFGAANAEGEYTNYAAVIDDNSNSVVVRKITNSNATLIHKNEDGSADLASFTDEEGNVVDSSNIFMCDVGNGQLMAYYAGNGKSLKTMAAELGINPGEIILEVETNGGSQYYYIDGSDATDAMGMAADQEWTEDELMNYLMNGLKDVGYNLYPEMEDYETLTWEQALAQASEQLSGAYDQALDTTLDDMNLRALQTGFYGQLPTEALKQQAASSTELNKQSAIYELARNLLSDSRNYSQSLYDSDVNTSEGRMNTIKTLYEMLASYYSTQTENRLSQQDVLNQAIELYAGAEAQGLTNSQIYENINNLIGSVQL